MTDKSTQEKEAAERQKTLIINALQNAKNSEGYWMNAKGKTTPRFYPQGASVSAFNSLTLALHSDTKNYESNLYTLFSDARHRGESVLAKEKGVPFNWYNWSHYVNRHKPDDIITRGEYLKLSTDDKQIYKGVKNREIRYLFNIEQTTLPFVDKEAYEKALQYHGSRNARGYLGKEDRILQRSINQLIALTKKNMIPIRKEASGVAHYDTVKDAVYMPDKNNFEEYKDYIREMLRQLVTATGHQQRLAREGINVNGGRTPVEDQRKHERLVTELATGVKCLELGIPAKLSHDSLELVDYWSRELKEDPNLLDAIEGEVNNAIDIIHKVEKDEKVERNTTLNNQQINELSDKLPRHYYVANEIKQLPDKDMKQFVLIKDPTNKSVEVVLPAGASLEVDNEIPGMNKKRIETALKKDGFERVTFFNVDGALGYNQDDSYFKNKSIVAGKLLNWKIDETTKLNINDAVERADNVDFEKILMMKDDDGKWTLYLKPENGSSFSIYPDKPDVNQFFTTLKQGKSDTMDQLRVELAKKYYLLAEGHPDLKVDLFHTNDNSIDISRLERVNVYKTKPKENSQSKILCLPVIKDMEPVKPREVSQQQWQRMWLADDKQEYKFQLAANLFADILRKEVKAVQESKTELDVKIEDRKEKIKESVNDSGKREENSESEKEHPFIQQFNALKTKHPDAIFLFRTGQFYESYFADASKVSEIVGTTQSEKKVEGLSKGIPVASFPTPALDVYLPKIIRSGERVAICDPLDQVKTKVNEVVVPTKAVEEDLTKEHIHLKR